MLKPVVRPSSCVVCRWVYSQLFAEGTDRPRATSDDAVIIEEGMREVQGRGYTGNQLINAQPELDLGKMGLRWAL